MLRRGEVAKGNRKTFIVVKKAEVTFKRINHAVNLHLCSLAAVD